MILENFFSEGNFLPPLYINKHPESQKKYFPNSFSNQLPGLKPPGHDIKPPLPNLSTPNPNTNKSTSSQANGLPSQHG